MKKKTLGKRIAREEEKEVKTVAQNTVKSMLQQANRARGSPWQMMKLAEQMNARAHNSVDIGYIRTLLYPELYNYDLPQPLSTQSYCRFTDKKDINIRSSMSQTIGAVTSTASDCVLIWYPKTICGPQLFVRYGNLTTGKEFAFKGLTGDTTKPDNDIYRWRACLHQDYTPYFSQANLVAASIQIQYIGQLQLEQGVIQCSQVFGVNPSNLTKDDVENGQFKCQSKPGDGLRAIYVPKDISDFQYYPTVRPKGSSITIRSKNNGGKPEGETYDILNSIVATSTADLATSYFLPPSVQSDVNWPSAADGSRPSIKYSLEGDAVVLYVMGMFTPSTEDLRIDITRKFNGFPLAQHRDILDLTKPKKIFDPKKTIDVIQELQTAIPTLCCHKLSQMDRVSDQIQEYLPNVGHLYDEGMLKEGTNLEQFAGQLQQIAGTEGFPTDAPGRIYE